MLRAGHRIEARGEHDDVELVSVAAVSRRPFWVRVSSGEPANVNQRDIVLVIGFEVLGVEDQALGPQWVVVGTAPLPSLIPTIWWILERTNAAAVSLASLLTKMSVKAPIRWKPPRCHLVSYSRCRSSGGTSRAPLVLGSCMKPNADVRSMFR